MSDWPRIIKTSDGNEIAVYEHTIALRWLNHLGRPVREHAVNVPEGEAAVELARAVLAAAGDTGHLVVSTEESARTIRIRQSIVAEDMRDRVIAGVVDLLETHGTTDALLNDVERLRALPLLPDGDVKGAVGEKTCTSKSTFMEEGATWSCGLAHGHLEMHESPGGKRQWTDSGADPGPAVAHSGCSQQPTEDPATVAVDVQARLAALEAKVTDLDNAREVTSRRVDDVQTDMRGAQDTIRGLGEAMQEQIQVNIDGLKGHTAEDWFEWGKKPITQC